MTIPPHYSARSVEQTGQQTATTATTVGKKKREKKANCMSRVYRWFDVLLSLNQRNYTGSHPCFADLKAPSLDSRRVQTPCSGGQLVESPRHNDRNSHLPFPRKRHSCLIPDFEQVTSTSSPTFRLPRPYLMCSIITSRLDIALAIYQTWVTFDNCLLDISPLKARPPIIALLSVPKSICAFCYSPRVTPCPFPHPSKAAYNCSTGGRL